MEADIKSLGKYGIESVLGKGAMGVVYKGFDPMIERHVAIKTIRKDLISDDPEQTMELARFKREAQAGGRLTHPNIVATYEYGEQDGTAYIAMEFVEGTTLKDFLDKDERFPLQKTVEVMEGLLSALGYSHSKGVVHRDIKPANIMITPKGEVKITDFGVARIETSTMTQAGAVLGTPSYMSPEQFMGQTVDKRSDLFSAGAVLYQLLTGEKPFTGSVTTIMHKVLNVMPPQPSALNVQVPRAFDGVVEKAMAKRPEERFQSASDFSAALKMALEGKSLPAAPVDEDATMMAGDLGGDATMVRPAAADATVARAMTEDGTVVRPLSGDATMARPGAAAADATLARPAGAPPPAAAPAKGGKAGLAVAAGLAVVVAAGAGAWFMLGGDKEPTAPESVVASAPAVQPVPAPPTDEPAPAPQAPPPPVAAPAPAPPPAPAEPPKPAAAPAPEPVVTASLPPPAPPAPAPIAPAAPAAPVASTPPAMPAPPAPAAPAAPAASTPPAMPAPTAPAVVASLPPLEKLGLTMQTDRGRDPVYRLQESMTITVTPQQDAYLYCFYKQGDGTVMRFFPNRFAPSAKVEAGKSYRIPDSAMPFQFVFLMGNVREAVSCVSSPHDIAADLARTVGAVDLEPLKAASLNEVVRAAVSAAGPRAAESTISIEVK